MGMFRFAWLVASLVFAAWAPTVRAVPTKEPPPLWSGESGWRSDPESLRVHEGRRHVGEVLAEYNVQLKRTGVVKKRIRVKTPRGEWTIPEGTKAFAVDAMLAFGPAQTPQKINPIEWCMHLPAGSDGTASASETPVANFATFAQAMAEVLIEREVEALNVSIRHSPADTVSLLRWAPQEVFSFVLYYKQRSNKDASARVRAWTRELIDAALANGGRYYLPYRIDATAAQFERSYPEARAFASLKSRIDPKRRFTNSLWNEYLL